MEMNDATLSNWKFLVARFDGNLECALSKEQNHSSEDTQFWNFNAFGLKL